MTKASLDELKINRNHARPPRRGWIYVTLAILFLLAAGGAAAYRYWPASGVAVHVASAQADAASASSALDASGYVVARREATLSPKIAGKLVEANLEEGERVTAGQVVARLDDSNYRSALNIALANEKLAETTLSNAEPTYHRYQQLRAQNAISEDAVQTQKTLYDSARMQLEVAKAAVAQAETNESDTVVRAPFTGIVTNKVAQAGDFVAPTAGGGGGGALTGIAHVVDMDSLEVDVDVSENYIDRVISGQKATVTLNAYPDWEIPASVIAVIPTADQSKGTVKVRVAIGAKDKRILPQMGARVSFLSDSKAAAAPVSHSVLIPQIAVQGVGDNASVFLVKDDGTVEVRPVSPGGKNGNNILIRGGLAPGDRVVIDNFDKLADGTTVAVAE
jgi:RND family efflux transporter MFP subunit